MYKKSVSWWRLLRTSMLLASTSALIFGCASHNPLIDETDEAEDAIVSTVDPDEKPSTRQTVQASTAEQKKDLVAISTQSEQDVLNKSKPLVQETYSKPVEAVDHNMQAKSVPVTNLTESKQTQTKKKTKSHLVEAKPAKKVAEKKAKDISTKVEKNSSTIPVVATVPQQLTADDKQQYDSTESTQTTEQTPEAENLPPQPLQIEKYSQTIPASDKALSLEENSEINSKPTGLKKWFMKFTPYKFNVQQGNFVSSEMIAKIQSGMNKEQVRFILGTPLLTDMFHTGRWDYLFRLQKQDGTITTNRVTVFFSGNIVNTIRTDTLPDETQYLKEISSDNEELEKKAKKIREQEKEKANEAEKEDARTVVAPEGDEDEEIQKIEKESSEPITSRNEKSIDVDRPSVKTVEPIQQTPQKSSVSQERAHSVSSSSTSTKQAPHSEPIVTEPVNVSTPVRSNEAEVAPVPEAPITKRARRTVYRDETPQTYTEEDEEIDNGSSGKLRHFKPISIPNRIERMVPETPNDKLIENIQ